MSDDEQPREPTLSTPAGGGRAAVEAKLPTMPESMRNLRACLLCSLVKTFDQFERVGCDNCEPVLLIKHDEEKVSSGVRAHAHTHTGVHMHVDELRRTHHTHATTRQLGGKMAERTTQSARSVRDQRGWRTAYGDNCR